MHENDPEIITLATIMAAMEGKLEQFRNNEDYKEGYLSEALDLALNLKIRGYMIVPVPLEEVVR